MNGSKYSSKIIAEYGEGWTDSFRWTYNYYVQYGQWLPIVHTWMRAPEPNHDGTIIRFSDLEGRVLTLTFDDEDASLDVSGNAWDPRSVYAITSMETVSYGPPQAGRGAYLNIAWIGTLRGKRSLSFRKLVRLHYSTPPRFRWTLTDNLFTEYVPYDEE